MKEYIKIGHSHQIIFCESKEQQIQLINEYKVPNILPSMANDKCVQISDQISHTQPTQTLSEHSRLH